MIIHNPNGMCPSFGVLGFGPLVASDINEKLLKPKAQRFFRARGIGNYQELEAGKGFTPEDFRRPDLVSMHVLYELLFDTLVPDRARRLEHIPRYFFTLDEESCPQVCESTKFRYAAVYLVKRPVGFAIFLPVAEVFAFLRGDLRRSVDSSPAQIDQMPAARLV